MYISNKPRNLFYRVLLSPLLISLWSVHLSRLAPKGGKDQRQEHFAEAQEALVCPHAQLAGLLQKLRTQFFQNGHAGAEFALLRHPAGRQSAQGDR